MVVVLVSAALVTNYKSCRYVRRYSFIIFALFVILRELLEFVLGIKLLW